MSRVALAVTWLGVATGSLALIGYNLAGAREFARPRWSLTEQFSAHHVLVAHVETRHLSESGAIARQLVEPRKAKYTEILIYFHRPGRPEPLAPRRVQWTTQNGYVETVYGQN